MNKSAAILGAITAITLANAAEASEHKWYASGQIGIRAVEQQTIDAPGAAIDLEQHNGVFASFASGRYFNDDGTGLRGEIEVAFRDGGRINRLFVNNTPVAATGDNLSSWSVMANAIVDLNNRSRFTPYIGAGLGVVMLDGDIQTPGNAITGTSSNFGIQGIAGVDVRVSDRISIFSDFRYQKAFGAELTLTGSAGAGSVSVDYDGYTVGAGVRVRF